MRDAIHLTLGIAALVGLLVIALASLALTWRIGQLLWEATGL